MIIFLLTTFSTITKNMDKQMIMPMAILDCSIVIVFNIYCNSFWAFFQTADCIVNCQLFMAEMSST